MIKVIKALEAVLRDKRAPSDKKYEALKALKALKHIRQK